jgi:hypothetical protein
MQNLARILPWAEAAKENDSQIQHGMPLAGKL